MDKKNSEEVKAITKDISPEEKKTNISLLAFFCLLLVTLGGIGYLYSNLKAAEKIPAFKYKKKSSTVQESEIPRQQGEFPTLTPERMEIVKNLEDHLVLIQNQTVSPQNLTIKLHDQVTWENKSSETHQIKGEDWGNVPIEPGEKFTQDFSEPGTYPYSCVLHPELTGTIIVK